MEDDFFRGKLNATFGPMAGANPVFMARLLGHSAEEFFKTYAKWIDSDADGLRMELVERALETDFTKRATDGAQKMDKKRN